MKLLVFSTSCDESAWNKIQFGSVKKASVAPVVFDNLLAKGLCSFDELELTFVSFPPFATFPKSKLLFYGGFKEISSMGASVFLMPIINLPILKSFSYFFSSFIYLIIWNLKNRNHKRNVLLSSQFVPVSASLYITSLFFNQSTILVLLDMPMFHFITKKHVLIDNFILSPYVFFANALNKTFKKYVFITKAMNCKVNLSNKPYVIIEGISDIQQRTHTKNTSSSIPKYIMYAGGLHKKYGLELLIEIFEELNLPDYQLWIYGSGDFENEIFNRSLTNKNIIFYGKVNRSVVLEAQKNAFLLVNLRDPSEVLTKFSFPSKNIEFMSSGTPLLITKLEGIPDEYYKYTFSVNYNKIDIKHKLLEILSIPENELIEFGKRASDFILNNKNYLVQCKSIFELISK